MQFFLLGAGRPSIGNKPTALRQVLIGTKALDWQLHSVSSIVEKKDIHFLGGYHAEEVNKSYPDLNISYIPGWEQAGALNTLLQAPFSNEACISAYSDTIFRKKTIDDFSKVSADLVIGIDSHWLNRYEDRDRTDISKAETLIVDNAEVEFTGLVKFSEDVISAISKLDSGEVGENFSCLISFVTKLGLSIQYYDLKGDWAEFNSPKDIAHFILGTKAETLARLEHIVCKSHIGRQISFTTSEWSTNSASLVNSIKKEFSGERLVVRSSSKGEDNWYASNAGGFESILNVDSNCETAINNSVLEVIDSYGNKRSGDDQVLVQPFLQNVKASGVIFTCGLETGSPYYRINFDDKTQSTESVTAGFDADLRTIVVYKSKTEILKVTEPKVVPVLEAVKELEQLLGFDKLDIEFAIDSKDQVHIFQVRPVTVDHTQHDFSLNSIDEVLNGCAKRFKALQSAAPHIAGDEAIFANMPDWNPAEIIGTRPRPLALTLYQYLITNDIWAKQRAEFGYKNVNPHPLLVSFAGQPYIDTRASFNSFIPDSVNEESTKRIVNAYTACLRKKPHLHDKVEFDVAFTIWTPGFKQKALGRLKPNGVTEGDIEQLEIGLKEITRSALNRLESDTSSIEVLSSREKKVSGSTLSPVDKLFCLLEDCKTYGTLAFSHAARAGFVATTILKYLVEVGVLSEERRSDFLKSFNTVAGEFEIDKRLFSEGLYGIDKLIEKYGHLRPGTYDATTQAYWEDPTKYFNSQLSAHKETINFSFNKLELDGLNTFLTLLGSNLSPDELVQYLVAATQAREKVKFDFTRSLSKAIDLCVLAGEELGLTRQDISYLTYTEIAQLRLKDTDVNSLVESIQTSKRKFDLTCAIELPPVINSEVDFFGFERFASQPNFVTMLSVQGSLVVLDSTDEPKSLTGKIVMIPQADPGYDWLFGQGISGLVTKYGGANSHMAIRAAEIGLPAAIGVGEKLYDKYSHVNALELDCINQIIRDV